MSSPSQANEFLAKLIVEGIRPREAQILEKIMLRPSPLKSFQEDLNLSKSNLSRLTGKMEKQGLIKVTPIKADPRKKLVEISKKGRSVAEKLFEKQTP